MSEQPIHINGETLIEIPDSEFFKKEYGAHPFMEGFLARHVASQRIAMVASELDSFSLLPSFITTPEQAHELFAFAARWYQQGKCHGANAKQMELRRALGV